MKNTSRLLATMLILVMAMSTVAFAATTADNLDSLASDPAGISNSIEAQLVKSIQNGDSWAQEMMTIDLANAASTYGSITVGGKVYYVASGYTAEEVIDKAETALNSANATEKTTDITNNLNISADTQGASKMMKGFIPVVNLVLGAMVVLITVGMSVFTAFDVCYITMPVFRNKCEDAKAQGSGPMVAKTANGGTKLRFVTDEAIFAVNNCSLESGKNPLTAYLGKRVVAFVAVAIILFILLTGNISVITNIALKLVSGLMDVLQSLS